MKCAYFHSKVAGDDTVFFPKHEGKLYTNLSCNGVLFFVQGGPLFSVRENVRDNREVELKTLTENQRIDTP
ncbi:hypothetical protein AL542_02670 [Grimontia hollisae]|nr:hypothetical protein AL542_02670 [Grimontia hollisae]STO77641.1 Uncharacterised protein [Grimontia hollisae]